MEDTQLYAMLLGILYPWRVSKVQVDMASQRVDGNSLVLLGIALGKKVRKNFYTARLVQ